VNKSWAGPAITAIILLAVGSFLFLNLETRKPAERPLSSSIQQSSQPLAPETAVPAAGSSVREYPIGDEVERNHIRVAAVWLPAVMMDDMPADSTAPMIHIEADVKALANNPNGFAKDEKVDYLKIVYWLNAASSGERLAQGELTPMMARDGFHYGATISKPKPGQYRLTYAIKPPSAGGLGRHSDPVTGVAPWWEPFQATFDWTVESDSGVKVATGPR